MPVQATNTFVFIIRDEVEKEKAGMFIPGEARVKPHQGIIISVGGLVRDLKIKNGKNKVAVFHAGVGFEIDIDEKTYLVLNDTEIIGIK